MKITDIHPFIKHGYSYYINYLLSVYTFNYSSMFYVLELGEMDKTLLVEL